MEFDLPPDPAALIESMRAFGYSLPAAIADLIDNSISAGARNVDVNFDWGGPESTVAVIDDGHGTDGVLPLLGAASCLCDRLGHVQLVVQRSASREPPIRWAGIAGSKV